MILAESAVLVALAAQALSAEQAVMVASPEALVALIVSAVQVVMVALAVAPVFG